MLSASRVTCFTSANLAYLDRALILESSLRITNPHFRVCLLLVDELPSDPATLKALGRFDDVVLAKDIYGDGFRSWIFGHDVVEACTAVKGDALVHFLADSADVVLYLDPDTAVFSPLDEVLGALVKHDAVLTPHQLEPDHGDREIQDNEIGSLITGVYNLGFIGVRNSAEGLRLAKWWAERLHKWCIDDPTRGLFTDQKWMNHAPVFFPTLGVLRDPGLNVASWNLSKRSVVVDHVGNYRVNGSILKFWHFTKALSLGPVMTERYGAEDMAVAELWRWYLERLGTEREGLGATPWAYDAYESGQVVTRGERRLYRERQDLRRAFPDPFSTKGESHYASWWAAHARQET